jgi:multiple sugar transport system substrate-binding protein
MNRSMKGVVISMVAVGLLATACSATTGGGNASPINTASGASHAPVTLNVWSFYTGREFKQYSDVLNAFTAKYPWITIHHTPGKVDQDYVRAINAGQAPDVAISAGPDNVAKFCSTQAYQDLTPFLQADGMDITKIVPPQALRYSSYQGDQCTLPVLSDAYGLYYNTDMFAAKGITSPPKSFSELVADAKKLTVIGADGSIKVAGFVPLTSFYENPNFFNGVYSGSKWYDAAGKSAFASDPSWAALLTWQKSFMTDVYGSDGYNKLNRFFGQLGGADSEWSSSQAFEIGKIAMAFDGEWRTAFIADDKATVKWNTAPFPVADNVPSRYGAGQIGGDVLGVPKGAQHPSEAWLLVKYLATDTGAEVQLAKTLGNVPTTYESLKDPSLTADPRFKTFLDIFANDQSDFKALTPIGSADADLWDTFIGKYEAGNAGDLLAGLKQLASQIDKQSSLG